MDTWTHCGREIERGRACPACRRKLVRVARAEDGAMSILQLGKLPKTGRAFDVLADHPAYRRSAEGLVALALVSPDPDPEVAPERFGLVAQARLRVTEVTGE